MFAQILLVGENVCFKKLFFSLTPWDPGSEPLFLFGSIHQNNFLKQTFSSGFLEPRTVNFGSEEWVDLLMSFFGNWHLVMTNLMCQLD